MEFEYLTNIIRRDPLCLYLVQLRDKVLMTSMRTCCIVDTTQEDSIFRYVISSEVDSRLVDIEDALYNRIRYIVNCTIETGYPRELGELFLNAHKPSPRKFLTDSIVMI